MTAQESYNIYLRYKAQADNLKKYHTDEIRPYNNKIIAKDGNWNLKLIIYSDFSAGLIAEAIPGTGCQNSHYCGIDILKYHLKDLKRIHKDDRQTLIPKYWKVVEPGFFKALEIE